MPPALPEVVTVSGRRHFEKLQSEFFTVNAKKRAPRKIRRRAVRYKCVTSAFRAFAYAVGSGTSKMSVHKADVWDG